MLVPGYSVAAKATLRNAFDRLFNAPNGVGAEGFLPVDLSTSRRMLQLIVS
jgi:hypothetical protein